MKLIYQCDICGSRFDVKEHCLACEARGIPDPANLPPIGTILGQSYYYDDGWCITFAVKAFSKVETSRHLLGTSLWAARDVPPQRDTFGYVHEGGRSDSLPPGKECCDGGFWLPDDGGRPDHAWIAPKQDVPSFDRMVRALKHSKITPYIWNEKTRKAERL